MNGIGGGVHHKLTTFWIPWVVVESSMLSYKWILHPLPSKVLYSKQKSFVALQKPKISLHINRFWHTFAHSYSLWGLELNTDIMKQIWNPSCSCVLLQAFDVDEPVLQHKKSDLRNYLSIKKWNIILRSDIFDAFFTWHFFCPLQNLIH